MKRNWTFEAEEVLPEVSQEQLKALLEVFAELLVDRYLDEEFERKGEQNPLTESSPEEQ